MLVLLSEVVNIDETERSNVRLISYVCFSFKPKDLLDIGGPSALNYPALFVHGRAFFP